jgi:hypothetical protein
VGCMRIFNVEKMHHDEDDLEIVFFRKLVNVNGVLILNYFKRFF